MRSIQTLSVVTFSFFIQTIIGIIFYLVIARTLPVSEVGAVSLFLSFGGIFMVAFALNIYTGFTHFISYFKGKTGKNSLPRPFLTMTLVVMVTSFLVIAALSHVIAWFFFIHPIIPLSLS